MKNLEKIDSKILGMLLVDGRRTFTSIAEATNTSVDIVSKHFSEMEKAGVIVGATVQQNYPLLGYQGVTSILIRSESQHTDEIIEYLQRFPRLSVSAIYGSNFNIMLITTIKGIKDLERITEMIKKRCSVSATRTLLWTDVRNIPENLTKNLSGELGIKKSEPKPPEAKNGRCSFDDLDLKIIDELTMDGRAPFSRIAESIGSSTDTVKRRYDRLVDNGFIKVSVQFNPQLLGYKAFIHFLISLSHQSELGEVVEVLSNIPNVSFITRLSGGDYDLLVCVLIEETEDLFSVTDQIRKIADVEKMDSYMRRLLPCWPGPRQYISTF